MFEIVLVVCDLEDVCADYYTGLSYTTVHECVLEGRKFGNRIMERIKGGTLIFEEGETWKLYCEGTVEEIVA